MFLESDREAQRTAEPAARDGWVSPRPDHIPRETYAPAAAALGVTFIFWGIVTTPVISVVGVVVLAVAVAAWIREARDELGP